MMYNNKVIQFGGNVVATAVYDVASNTWTAGPTPPNQLDQADGPAALEPNGKVLAMLSPGLFAGGCQFLEYNPTSNTLASTANPTNCPGDSSFVGHLMILPTGQIMFTDFSGLVEVYTPASGVVAGVAPTILAASTFLKIGSTNNILYGSQLNGLSGNNAYGDDYQGETNYPLVRLTNTQTGNVYYAFTSRRQYAQHQTRHDHVHVLRSAFDHSGGQVLVTVRRQWHWIELDHRVGEVGLSKRSKCETHVPCSHQHGTFFVGPGSI